MSVLRLGLWNSEDSQQMLCLGLSRKNILTGKESLLVIDPHMSQEWTSDPASPGMAWQANHLLSNIFSWFCPHTCPAGRSSLSHMVSLPRRAASWSDTPSGPGAPRRTRGGRRRPCPGTRSTRAQMSGCTAAWRRTSVPGVPRGPGSACVVDLANSYLKEQPRLTTALCLGFKLLKSWIWKCRAPAAVGTSRAHRCAGWGPGEGTPPGTEQGLPRGWRRAPLCVHQPLPGFSMGYMLRGMSNDGSDMIK